MILMISFQQSHLYRCYKINRAPYNSGINTNWPIMRTDRSQARGTAVAHVVLFYSGSQPPSHRPIDCFFAPLPSTRSKTDLLASRKRVTRVMPFLRWTDLGLARGCPAKGRAGEAGRESGEPLNSKMGLPGSGATPGEMLMTFPVS